MKRIHKTQAARRQQGGAMIDAMIATLLVMIMGLGPMYVTGKATVAQRTAGGQQLVAGELRQLLLNTPHDAMCDADGNVKSDWTNPQEINLTGLATGGGTAPAISITVTTLCYASNTALTINDTSVSRSTVTLVGCASAPLASMGPIIVREGDVANNEPTSCSST